jgi:hypothetical protein
MLQFYQPQASRQFAESGTIIPIMMDSLTQQYSVSESEGWCFGRGALLAEEECSRLRCPAHANYRSDSAWINVCAA